MDSQEYVGHPFAIPDLWNSVRLSPIAEELPTLVFSNLTLKGIIQVQAVRFLALANPCKAPETPLEHLHLSDLPQIGRGTPDAFHWGPILDDAPSFSESIASDAGSTPADDEGDYIWDPSIQAKDETQTVCRRWETFIDSNFQEPPSAYLSEAGPASFDALLRSHEEEGAINKTSHAVVKTPIFLSCLVQLGLGQSSALFRWNANEQKFQCVLGQIRIHGCSDEASDGLCRRFLQCGTHTRFLQDSVEETYSSPRSTPVQIALAETISMALSALQARTSASRPSIRSLLQLRALFRQPCMIVDCFSALCEAARTSEGDEQLLSTIYGLVQQLEYGQGWLRDILLEVLSRVSRPWLDSVALWIGLRDDGLPIYDKQTQARTFVSVEQKTWVDERGIEKNAPEYTLDQDRVPAFLPKEEAKVIFETGRSIRLLKTHHPLHPLARPGISASTSTEGSSLDWKYSWEQLEQIKTKAQAYEQGLVSAIRKFAQRQDLGRDQQSQPEERLSNGIACPESRDDILANIKESGLFMDKPLADLLEPSRDRLRRLVLNSCSPDADDYGSGQESSVFAPPIPMTALLSFGPIISAQARLVNSSCLRLLFREHQVRAHLSLQRRFHLFGDGTFASRLSHALFDPELESAQRRRGVARSGTAMGLKLGSRENWPPASSELRLALMGLLSESYSACPIGESDGRTPSVSRDGELPGGLSFAVRDMSEEELDKCKDANSIEALDFLRLQYKPPSPLDSIITATCLFKYDRLFRLLLRVVRMNFVVNQLFRNGTDRTSYWQGIDLVAQKFRIEAHHFVSTICSYFFDVCIGATWQKFEHKLDEIEQRLKREDEGQVSGLGEGVERLREYHERVLDRILFATLLRRRQEQVMKLLEDIFAEILTFAQYSHKRALGLHKRPGDDEELGQMYRRFKRRVGVFVNVCRGLSEKPGYGEKQKHLSGGEDGLFGSDDMAEEGGNTISQLLLKLDMSSYYSESRIR